MSSSSDILDLRKELKKWETQFSAKNDRKPNKTDIDEAPDDIRALYKTYQQSKTSKEKHKVTTIQPSQEEAGDNIWNVRNQSDKPSVKPAPDSNITVSTESEKKMSLFQSYSRRLQNSDQENKKWSVCGRKYGVAKKSSPDSNTSLSTEKQYIERKSLEECSLKEPSTNINNSETNITPKQGGFPRSKLQVRQPDQDVTSRFENLRKSMKKSSRISSLAKLLKSEESVERNQQANEECFNEQGHKYISSVYNNVSKSQSDSLMEESPFSPQQTVSSSVNNNSNHRDIISDEQTESVSVTQPQCFTEQSSALLNSPVVKHTPVKRKLQEETNSDFCQSFTDSTGQLHSSSKRMRQEETDDKTTPESDVNKKQNTTEEKPVARKTTKSSSSGQRSAASLNENYVRINLKKKTFCRRGPGQLTGAMQKKQIYKQKLKKKFGDKNHCFNCGGEGHWANKCTQKKGAGKTDSFDTAGPGDLNLVSKLPGDNKKEIEQLNEMLDNIKIQRIQMNTLTSTPDTVTTPDPLYQPDAHGCITETPGEVLDTLNLLGFKSFRAGQEQAMMRILSGLSTLVVLSTGSGKSLCYQLPAFMYARQKQRLTLVVSPLVSLMEDQVYGLPSVMKGVCLHRNLTDTQRQKVIESIRENSVDIVLVSPEAVVGSNSTLVSLLSQLPPLAFACIDEAHCVSEWSHNFRPSYLRLCKILRETLGVTCILALTATATKQMCYSIAEHIGIAQTHEAIITGYAVPSNLILSVSADRYRDESLVELFRNPPYTRLLSLIVYCTRRQDTERIATLLRTSLKDYAPVIDKDEQEQEKPTKGKRKKPVKVQPAVFCAEAYHAGLTSAARKRVQTRFMSGQLRIVVATVAFGMGLDKSDVRAIIHYNMPRNFESYVQEIGRAGRDWKTSYCHLFLSPEGKDLSELRRHIYANSVDRSTIKKFVVKIFPDCRCIDTSTTVSGECTHERAVNIEKLVHEFDIKEEGIETLLCYLELHPSNWLQVLQPCNATCVLQCYGGVQQLKTLATSCRAVAVALAFIRRNSRDHSWSNRVEIPLVEVVDLMNWELGLVRKDLRELQWSNSGQYTDGKLNQRRTGIQVEFSDFSFHYRGKGSMSFTDKDFITDYLYNRVRNLELSDLTQLNSVFDTFRSVSCDSWWKCYDDVDNISSEKLKNTIITYFDKSESAESVSKYSKLNFGKNEQSSAPQSQEEVSSVDNERQVILDIRAFLNIHHDHDFTARALARIFHGIESPNYPASVWGRVRRYWRCHIDVDFNLVVKLARQEIIVMR